MFCLGVGCFNSISNESMHGSFAAWKSQTVSERSFSGQIIGKEGGAKHDLQWSVDQLYWRLLKMELMVFMFRCFFCIWKGCVVRFSCLSSESSSSASKTRFDSKRTASGTACEWIDPMSKATGLFCFSCSVWWKKAFISSPATGKRSQRDRKNTRTKCESVGNRELIQA